MYWSGKTHRTSDNKHYYDEGTDRPYTRQMPIDPRGYIIRTYDDGGIEYHYQDGSGKVEVIQKAGGSNTSTNPNEITLSDVEVEKIEDLYKLYPDLKGDPTALVKQASKDGIDLSVLMGRD